MQITAKTPTSVRLAQGLFFLNTAIWLAIGIISLIRLAGGDTGVSITFWIVAILMFFNASAMFVAGVGVGTQRRFFYYLALALLVVNLILTVTDQFGWLDLLTMLIDLVLLGLLIQTRKNYSIAR